LGSCQRESTPGTAGFSLCSVCTHDHAGF
jgi:hypothetical protein